MFCVVWFCVDCDCCVLALAVSWMGDCCLLLCWLLLCDVCLMVGVGFFGND